MKKNTLIVLLIFLIFSAISFLTNILGPLVPDIINSFDLSIGLAGFLPFSFFVAYGVMSVPGGLMSERYSEKTVILIGFFVAFLAAMFFALVPTFTTALLSLFSIGIGMAMLQVVINPLLRHAGGDKNFAFNSALANFFFGAASVFSPLLYSVLVNNIHTGSANPLIAMFDSLVAPDLKWVSVYWVFAVTSLLMMLLVYFIRFPRVELKEDEKIESGGVLISLLRKRIVLLYFVGIFCYVGTEQGIANWTSKFLEIYHGVDPSTQGAVVISYFWALITIGCFAGLFLLKLFDSRSVLKVFASGALVALMFALFGSKDVALVAFPATGFFLSIMWSIIFSLGMNSLSSHHGTFSGILCTGIVGGAVVPLIIGGLAELMGLQLAMLFMVITLGYILCIGTWARPLVNNATLPWRKLFQKKTAS